VITEHVTKWVEVSGSDIGPETGCSECGFFFAFPQSLQENAGTLHQMKTLAKPCREIPILNHNDPQWSRENGRDSSVGIAMDYGLDGRGSILR
jgi:hypothetical protein